MRQHRALDPFPIDLASGTYHRNDVVMAARQHFHEFGDPQAHVVVDEEKMAGLRLSDKFIVQDIAGDVDGADMGEYRKRA